MIKMIENAAKLLAERFGYRARRLNGQWLVWCDESDHCVEFDARTIENAINNPTPRVRVVVTNPDPEFADLWRDAGFAVRYDDDDDGRQDWPVS